MAQDAAELSFSRYGPGMQFYTPGDYPFDKALTRFLRFKDGQYISFVCKSARQPYTVLCKMGRHQHDPNSR
jgi:hypothetical protein